MASYGVAEAKNNFTQLLDRVQEGESITITKHGKPIAELSPTPKLTTEERWALMDELNEWSRRQPPLELSAVELVRSMRDGDPE